jgi:peptidyl-prolyl cis-trans isomerase D
MAPPMQYGGGGTARGRKDFGMLKTMREGGAYFIKGVMLVLVVAFIGTIFVVWGVQSTPGDLARRGVVATVGDTEITADEFQQTLRREIESARRLFGDKLDDKLLESLNLKQQVLEGLIRRNLIRQQAERMGIGVTEEEVVEEIRRIPAFAGKEGFSRQRYLEVLRANHLTPDRFEADLRWDLTERKLSGLILDAVKLSEAETKEAFRELRRQLTVEVVHLRPGEEGKKLADTITLAIGKGKSLAEAGREAGITPKVHGPFPASVPPKEIPDPVAFAQAAGLLKPGEVSPLVTGGNASYLLRLVSQQDPPDEEYEKEKAAFREQLLGQKRQAVFGDWLRQLRQTAKVTVDRESL